MKGQHKASNYLEPSWINISPSTNILIVCVSKIAKFLFWINRVKNFIGEKTRKTPYFAMVHSYLVYCLSIYNCANNTNLNKLKITQKSDQNFMCLDFGECYVTLDYCIAILHAL
jgi:hypothetical protein